MNLDRQYLVWALGYAVAGMAVGIFMAASKNHGLMVAHAHIMLVGFLVSLLYGVIHRLWLDAPKRALARVQFVVHQVAAFVLSAGLTLLYGHVLPEATLDPVLGLGSVGVLVGMLLMFYMALSARPPKNG